ncbi:hypothetical protein IJO12_04185 [bacterium]|nr:hypothetical protein [bacterium]
MVVSYPTSMQNYCTFSNDVQKKIERGAEIIPDIKNSLSNPKNEDEIVENLYILNMMIDNGTDIELVKNLYPELSKYNDTKSPNIQTFLAGIYRKTKIPDAFGPLVKMLIQDSINPPQNCHFDPTEEIGGAILDYLA